MAEMSGDVCVRAVHKKVCDQRFPFGSFLQLTLKLQVATVGTMRSEAKTRPRFIFCANEGEEQLALIWKNERRKGGEQNRAEKFPYRCPVIEARTKPVTETWHRRAYLSYSRDLHW
jgi:hypothetical protein